MAASLTDWTTCCRLTSEDRISHHHLDSSTSNHRVYQPYPLKMLSSPHFHLTLASDSSSFWLCFIRPQPLFRRWTPLNTQWYLLPMRQLAAQRYQWHLVVLCSLTEKKGKISSIWYLFGLLYARTHWRQQEGIMNKQRYTKESLAEAASTLSWDKGQQRKDEWTISSIVKGTRARSGKVTIDRF